MSASSPVKGRVLVLAERAVDRGGEVDPAELAVGVVAEIDDVVLAQLVDAEQRGPGREAVLVE